MEMYRYDRVTLGLLIGDFRFRKRAPAAGDQFPDFNLQTLDGQTISNADFVDNRPLLLIFGSKSCPLTESSMEPLTNLYQRYGEDVTFVTVNVREAHPGELVRQPVDYHDKVQNALDMKERFHIPWSVAVDDIDGSLHRDLDAKPNSAFLMDVDGKIAFRTLFAGDDKALEQALSSISRGVPVPRRESQSMLRPMLRSIGYIYDVLKYAGPQAERDMLRVAPPLIVASRVANLFPSLSKQRRGKAAVTTMLLASAAILGGIGALLLA